MKILNTDGIGIRALLGAAEKLHELTVERNIILGVIEDPESPEDEARMIGVVLGTSFGHGQRIAVTIEKNPRLVDLDG